MILEMMAVYDTKARAFLAPIFVRSVEVAQRAVADAVNDPKHEWHRHASDFVLFGFGAFADDQGTFSLLQEPRNYGPLSQWQEPSPQGELALATLNESELLAFKRRLDALPLK